MYDPNNSSALKLARWGITILCAIVCVWLVASAILDYLNTGVVSISSSDSHAGLVVTQDNKQAKLAGVGKAKLRVKPGAYQVSASNNGKAASVNITVSRRKTVKAYLNPTKLVRLPTVDDVSFSGTNALLNFGMQSTQLDNLKLAFFQYSPAIKNVVIDTNSINFAPHDRYSTSTLSAASFNVLIDKKPFKATINYDNLGSGFRLILYDAQNGNQVFDSYAINKSVNLD